jgi:hypothetical protein
MGRQQQYFAIVNNRESSWQRNANHLWDLLVPDAGQCDTIQGKLMLVIETCIQQPQLIPQEGMGLAR